MEAILHIGFIVLVIVFPAVIGVFLMKMARVKSGNMRVTLWIFSVLLLLISLGYTLAAIYFIFFFHAPV